MNILSLKNKSFIGNGPKKICVLSQILPDWSADALFTQIFSGLTNDFTLHVFDSLAMINEFSALKDTYVSWGEKLSHCDYDMYIGLSFGGCVLQNLLNESFLKKKKIIFFSVPAFVDSDLKKKLTALVDLLEEGNIAKALWLLEILAQALDANIPTYKADINIDSINQKKAMIKKRLLAGFRMILDHDATSVIKDNNISTLSIVGENSQLVTSNNIMMNASSKLVVIPSGSMRVLSTHNDICLNLIKNFFIGG